MQERNRLQESFCALILVAYFVWFTWPALRIGFTHDDLMNLHRSWHPNLRAGWRDVLFFFRPTDSFRPVGNLFYRAIFEGFGLNPLAFRIGCYGLLAVNLWLTYCVTRRLSDSRLVGSLCVLLLAYHREFYGFYVNTGLCYDLLCWTFFLAAFLFYLRESYAGFAVCYLFALNSKEVAVALPAMLLCYELLYRKPVRWKVPAIAGLAAILFIAGRVLASQGLGGNARYQVDLSPSVYFSHGYHYFRAAFYNWPSPTLASAIVLGLAVWAWRSRSKALWFALCWMVIALLPIAFIPTRELDSASIAAVGLALCLGTVLASAGRFVRPAVIFGTAVLALGLFQQRYGSINFYEAGQEGRHIESVWRELPIFPRNARVLFLQDPFPAFEHSSKMLIQLMAEDPTIDVVHTGSRADYVLSWSDGHLLACKLASGIAGDKAMAAQAVAAPDSHWSWSCGKPLWK